MREGEEAEAEVLQPFHREAEEAVVVVAEEGEAAEEAGKRREWTKGDQR